MSVASNRISVYIIAFNEADKIDTKEEFSLAFEKQVDEFVEARLCLNFVHE